MAYVKWDRGLQKNEQAENRTMCELVLNFKFHTILCALVYIIKDFKSCSIVCNSVLSKSGRSQIQMVLPEFAPWLPGQLMARDSKVRAGLRWSFFLAGIFYLENYDILCRDECFE